MAWYVYMLRCGDDSLYTGVTTDPQRRLRAHQQGKGAKYTRSRLPVELVYQEPAADKSAALRREAAIKKLRRAEKWNLLQQEETAMRRKDRELQAVQAWEIVDGCDQCVLAMTEADGAPYAAPLNFVREGEYLYFHSALTGRKLDRLTRDGRVCVVCVAADAVIDQPQLTTRYASAILRGTAAEVTEPAEKVRALRLLCRKLAPENPEGQGDFQSCLSRTVVWRIAVESITGKANRGK